jgi:tetratricopeptide (TPR) repeat protein
MTAHVLSYFGRMLQTLGAYQEAKKLLYEGLDLARKTNYRFAMGLAFDGLGKVAHGEGNYEEARAFYLESIALFREAGDHRLARTLNHQGLNSLALGDTVDAQSSFQTALKMAMQGGLIPIAIDALMGLASLETGQKPAQETFELVLYLSKHPASAHETKDRVNHLRKELESRLSQGEIDEAHRHILSKSLDQFASQVLANV